MFRIGLQLYVIVALITVCFAHGYADDTDTDTDADFETMPTVEEEPKTCTYSTYEWSVEKRGPVNRRTVSKPYSEVEDGERNPDDPRCTVCQEDQTVVDLKELGFAGLSPIRVCRFYSDKMTEALKKVAESGEFKIVSAIGYRPGRTRGPLINGLRTVFSNHSFGTAIDINAKFNGMYNRCGIDGEITPKGLKKCHLAIGGAWRPKKNRLVSIVKEGVLYKAFTEILGWRWGGEIPGKTKDIMHFSITGY